MRRLVEIEKETTLKGRDAASPKLVIYRILREGEVASIMCMRGKSEEYLYGC